MQNSKNVGQILISWFAKLRKISPKFRFRVSRNLSEYFAKHAIKNFAKFFRNYENENFRSELNPGMTVDPRLKEEAGTCDMSITVQYRLCVSPVVFQSQ